MKIAKESHQIDAIIEDNDVVQVEFQEDISSSKGKPIQYKMYVHVNGETILRLGKINIHNITIINKHILDWR